MDVLGDDQTLQAVLGRAGDEDGFDNDDGLDFRVLEDYINDENGSTSMWGDLAHEVSRPHLAAAVVSPTAAAAVAPPNAPNAHTLPAPVLTATLDSTDERLQYGAVPPSDTPTIYIMPNHSLPESPPDSGSEPPYSPQEHTGGFSPSQKSGAVNAGMMLLPPGSAMYAANPQQPPQQLADGALVQVLLPPADTNMVCCEPSPNPLQTAPAPSGPPVGAPAPPIPQQPQQTPLLNNPASVNKKRKLSQDGVHVKLEPTPPGISAGWCPEQLNEPSVSPNTTLDDDICGEGGEASDVYSDPSFQCIRFNSFQQSEWHVLCDQGLNELSPPKYQVVADKGFNYSNADEAFVCQKKNHFQITCHVLLVGAPQFVKTVAGLKKVVAWRLHFYGVKTEAPAQRIKVEQSQSDRSKRAFHPVQLELQRDEPLKATVGRLHFSETTSNNMRKKGKPNPDQRYFLLVVALHAHCADGTDYPVVAHASERIIVRASNPGQFESDTELCWQKGAAPDSVWRAGRVGVNTDRPDEALVVHGNARVTGHLLQPSDARAKTVVAECDTRQSLLNVSQLRVFKYHYAPDFARHAGLPASDVAVIDTGVLAQDVQRVLPEAVRNAGDLLLPGGRRIDNFLVVNKDRIFMENVGAVKELYKVTDNLETRVDELEKISRRLAKTRRHDSMKSAASFTSVTTGLPIHGHHCKRIPAPAGPSVSYGFFSACSNSLVQATTVILVLIMAVCLAAMATLYFMEYYRRGNAESTTSIPQQVQTIMSSPHDFSSTWSTTLHTKSPADFPQKKKTSKKESQSSSTTIRSSPDEITSRQSSTSESAGAHSTAVSLPVRTSASPATPSSTSPPPPIPVQNYPADKVQRPAEKCKTEGNPQTLTCTIFCSYVPSGNLFDVANQTSRPPISTSFGGVSSSTPLPSGILALNKSSDQPPTELTNGLLGPANDIPGHAGGRQRVEVSVWDGDKKIILGPELCAKPPFQAAMDEERCRTWKADNYTYLMPLRQDLSEHKLDFEFKFVFPIGWTMPGATRCPRDNRLPCKGLPMDVTFRVLRNSLKEPKDLCGLSSSLVGKTFLEYNIHFQQSS